MEAQVAANEELEERLRALWSTGVSAAVACLRLVRFLPPGFLFALVDNDGRVELSDASEGTLVKPLERHSLFRSDLLDPMSSEHRVIRLGQRSTRWWYFEERVARPAEDVAGEPSSEILDRLLERHFAEGDRQRVQHRVSGIIGYGKDHASDSSAEAIYGALQGRFTAREDLADLVNDDEFQEFLSRRAGELGESSD